MTLLLLSVTSHKPNFLLLIKFSSRASIVSYISTPLESICPVYPSRDAIAIPSESGDIFVYSLEDTTYPPRDFNSYTFMYLPSSS